MGKYCLAQSIREAGYTKSKFDVEELKALAKRAESNFNVILINYLISTSIQYKGFCQCRDELLEFFDKIKECEEGER